MQVLVGLIKKNVNLKIVAKDIGVGIKFIGNKGTLIDYINNKYKGNEKTRYLDRITNFVVFSHGLPKDGGVIALCYNYNQDYNKSLNLDKNDIINSIYATAFNNPISVFYSCNTGTSGDSSFAQTWVNKFKGVTYAFSGKSNYEKINQSGFHPFIKASRYLHGFSYYGSVDYPVAGDGASFLTFFSK